MNESFRFAGDLFPELTRLQQYLEQAGQPASTPSIRPFSRGGFPAVNVGSSPDSIEILALAPGVDPKALQITVDKGLLVIAGERSSDVSNPGNKDIVCAHERFSGPFRRVISLPDDADPLKVDATFRDGVLRISVAKRESSKPRQIAIT
jgi:HSP20 family protein